MLQKDEIRRKTKQTLKMASKWEEEGHVNGHKIRKSEDSISLNASYTYYMHIHIRIFSWFHTKALYSFNFIEMNCLGVNLLNNHRNRSQRFSIQTNRQKNRQCVDIHPCTSRGEQTLERLSFCSVTRNHLAHASHLTLPPCSLLWKFS